MENAGPGREAVDALVALAELMAIPVIEGPGAFFTNFPKTHDLYLGSNVGPYLEETDLALLVESRAPWYPPSNAPRHAEIVAIGESPLKGHMVYQVMNAGHYLEGSAGCNSYGIDYITRANEFRVPEIHRTQFSCDVAPDVARGRAPAADQISRGDPLPRTDHPEGSR